MCLEDEILDIATKLVRTNIREYWNDLSENEISNIVNIVYNDLNNKEIIQEYFDAIGSDIDKAIQMNRLETSALLLEVKYSLLALYLMFEEKYE